MQKKNITISSILLVLSLLLITTISNNSIDVKAWEITATPVCIATGDQQNAKIIQTSDGDFIITWDDGRGIDYNIYAQKFDSRGNPQWTLDGIPVCNASGAQFHNRPFSDGYGGVYILWWDGRSGTDFDIYAQRIDSSGAPLWDVDGIPISNLGGDQIGFDVCSDGLISDGGPGGIIVTWQDEREGNNLWDIYAQRITLNGVTLWDDNGTVVCNATERQTNPKIVPDYNGGAFISWTDRRSGSTDADRDIYITRINSAGDIYWTKNGIVVCSASGEQSYQFMINGWLESAIIMWTDRRDGEPDIYVQHIDKYGVRYWGGNGMAVCTADGDQGAHALCSDGNYGAIVAWVDERDDVGSFDYDVYAQHINISGVIKWTPNGTLVCNAENAQTGISMISDGDNGAILAWVDHRSPSETLLYAQRIDSDGSGLWGDNGTAVDPLPNVEQWITTLALSETGEAIITWQDDRNSATSDIWAKYMIDNTIPSSSTPPHAKYQQRSTATITWTLYDNSGGGHYKVRRAIPESIQSTVIIPWTEWDHGDTIIVPINTTAVGVWFYRIEYNDSNGNNGISHAVLINITARSPPGDPDLGLIIVIAAVSGAGIAVVVLVIIVKKRKTK